MVAPRANPPYEPWPDGWFVRHVEETGSTNSDLVELAKSGAAHHSVIVADHQTAGRGRLDRKWEAPAGSNLLVSLLFRPVGSRPPHLYTHVVGLAARAACAEVFGIRPDLKWPNDLLIGERKVAGILAQGGDGFVVVGIGVNVRWAPEGAARLVNHEESDPGRGPLDLLRVLLREVDRVESMSVTDLRARYVSELATIGRRVRIETTGVGVLEGTAIGVDDGARLEVRTASGDIVGIDVGDVVHLRT